MLFDKNSSAFIKQFSFLFGIYGVELFFVLSGFLIGRILINLYYSENYISRIKTFYLRRWFRTLPLYYLVLIISFIILIFSEPNTNIFSPFYLKYIFFIQNFDLRFYQFFPQSWSLSIEEWFYLLMPVVLLFFYVKKIRPENLYRKLLILILLITAARFCYVIFFNPALDPGIRNFIPLRLDAILTGVVFACIKTNNKIIYEKFLTKNISIMNFALLMIITCCLYYSITHPITSLSVQLLKIFSWNIISFSFGLLIVFFEHNAFINEILPKIPFIKTIFEKTSLYSYSMYLFQGMILIYLINHTGLFNRGNYLFFSILLSTAIIYIVSAFTYKYIEKPIMKVRDKF